MKHAFLRVLAALLCLACAAVPLQAQGTALQKDLLSIVRPGTGLVGLSPTGELYRSSDSGVTWALRRAADTPRALYAVAVSGSTVIAMGDAGNFARSTDDGATWPVSLAQAVNPAFSGAINALATNGSTWVAVGGRGGNFIALHSLDNGVTWSVATSLVTPFFGGTLRGVTWSGTKWVAVGSDGSKGYTTTSTDGDTWSAPVEIATPLYAVSSGSGTIIAVGDSGAILQSTDNGTTFTTLDSGNASEALRSVAFLSAGHWIAGGDNAVLISITGTTPALVSGPSANTVKPITALLSDGTATGYYYYSEDVVTPPTPHGSISFQIAVVSGQLKLTLVGAETGNSYQLETSTALTSWSLVADSTQAYTGGAAPSWTRALPSAGNRVFYRAKLSSP